MAELGRVEGLVERHRTLQERLESLEADAAQFDTSAQGLLELSQKVADVRLELADLLEQLLERVNSRWGF